MIAERRCLGAWRMLTIREVLKKRAKWNAAIVFGSAGFLFVLTLHGGARTPWFGWLMWIVMIVTAALLLSWLVDLRMRCPICQTRLGKAGYKFPSCPNCGANLDAEMPPRAAS
jgi:hypothetical protein